MNLRDATKSFSYSIDREGFNQFMDFIDDLKNKYALRITESSTWEHPGTFTIHIGWVFAGIDEDIEKASKDLAEKYGENKA